MNPKVLGLGSDLPSPISCVFFVSESDGFLGGFLVIFFTLENLAHVFFWEYLQSGGEFVGDFLILKIEHIHYVFNIRELLKGPQPTPQFL